MTLAIGIVIGVVIGAAIICALLWHPELWWPHR